MGRRDWPNAKWPVPARTLCGGDRREVFASIDLGFQGALNWFRRHTGAIGRTEIELFSGKAIDVPSLFLSGIADWGTYRKPGAVERMCTTTCPKMTGVELIEGEGHWIISA